MGRVFIVLKRMGGVVTSATNIGAYQTDPEVFVGGADGAFGGYVIEEGSVGSGEGGICVPADGAGGVAPFGEAGTVEDMLAEDSEKAGGFVHPL